MRTADTICAGCRWHMGGAHCAAYPGGIPADIMYEGADHREARGDEAIDGLVFGFPDRSEYPEGRAGAAIHARDLAYAGRAHAAWLARAEGRT